MSAKSNYLNFKKVLQNEISILSILLGTFFISLSIGPFQNPDTVWEYKAATGVILWGMPFVEVQGSLINQPPLGFYFESLFLRLFGTSIETGSILVTLFGVGCVWLVYKIGNNLYSKNTGLFASILFALSPWQLVLSNTFLIDTQCLFFSLLCFFLGIIAFRNNSSKLVLLSGTFFAMAFFTKLFAVFVLLPLFIFYLYFQNKTLKFFPVKMILFIIPIGVACILWYLTIFFNMPNHLPRNLDYMFSHSDLSDLNAAGVVPSYYFIFTFLVNYGLGNFFVASVIFSIIIGIVIIQKINKAFVIFDIAFLASILAILGLTLYLGVGLNLKVPYTSTIKYGYQALPFFSLIAASIVVKINLLIHSELVTLQKKFAYSIITFFGFFLLLISVIANMYSANELSFKSFIIFQVEIGKLLGYSFDNFHALTQPSSLLCLQYLGFGILLFSIILSNKVLIQKLLLLFKTTFFDTKE